MTGSTISRVSGLVSSTSKKQNKSRQRSLRRAVVATPAVAALLAFGGGRTAHAAQLYFDTDGQGPAAGGPGVWNTTDLRWATVPAGTVYSSWANGPDEANLGGAGGTMLVDPGQGITTNGFHTTGGEWYFLNGLGSTLSTNSGTYDVGAGGYAFFVSTTSGTGITKTGTGTFGFYSGTSGTPTGLYDIQQGTFKIPSDITGTTGRAITIAAGATFDIAHSSVSTGALNGAGTISLSSQVRVGTISGGRIQMNTDNSNSTFSGAIVGGTARVQKGGTGQLVFNGHNTYTGATTIAGELVDNTGDFFPDADPAFVQGTSTLTLNASETIGSLGSAAAGTTSALVKLNAGSVVLTMGGDGLNNQYGGTFASLDATALVKKVGSGNQQIGSGSGNPTVGSTGYTGKWEVANGILAISPSASQGDIFLGAVPGAVTADAIKLSGGTFAGSLSSGGFATFAINANRGITVSAPSGIGEYSSTLTSTMTVNSKITGSAGTGNLTKVGGAIVVMNSDNSSTYSGNWNVVDGALQTTSPTAAKPFGTGSITVTQSGLSVAPSGSVTNVATAAGALTYGAGAQLQIKTGLNPGATLTLDSLSRGTDGSLLVLADAGIPNLGTGTEKIISTAAPTTVNGIVPGVIGTQNAGQTRGEFLGYDNTNGLVKATYTATDATTVVGTTDVVNQTANAVLGSPKTVYALRIDDNVDLNLNTSALTIGAGADPAMLIVNPGSTLSTGGAGGVVDFGGRPAVVFAAGTAGTVAAPLTNATSFSKLGNGALSITSPMAYTGKTYINQGSLLLNNPELIPDTSDVQIGGSSILATVGSLNLNNNFETVKSLSGTTQADLQFGSSGTLKIVGNSTTTYLGGGGGGAQNGTSQLWVAGGGTLNLGPKQATATGGVGLGGKTFTYNSLKITNGSRVVIGASSYVPRNPVNPANGTVDPNSVILDNGTIEFTTAQIGDASVSGGGASTVSFGANRGLTVAAGGGTIRVSNPYEIALLQTGNNQAATDIGNNIQGPGTLTKDGPGVLRLGNSDAAHGTQFTGKWVIAGGVLQFQTDVNGENGATFSGSALGAAPASFVADGITIKNNAVLNPTNGDGHIHHNRGIFIDATGGQITTTNSQSILNSVISGPGTLSLVGTTTPKNVSFEASNNTYAGLVVKAAFANFNGNESGPGNGTGTITMDPSSEKIALGKDEGPASTISNPITMLPGGLIDIRVASDATQVVGSIITGSVSTGPLTLAGKITGAGSFFKGYDSSFTYAPAIGTGGTRSLDGEVILANSTNDFTGNVMVNTGTLVVAANNALGSTAGSTMVGNLGTIGFKGGINYTANENMIIAGTGGFGPDNVGAINNIADNNTFAGNIAVGANATINIAGGTLTTGSVHGQSVLTVQGPAPANFLQAQNVRTSGLNVSGNKVVITPSSLAQGVSVVRSTSPGALQLSSAPLDLTNNKLVTTDAVGSWTGTNYTDTTAYIATGRNGGSWNAASGITTSMPNGNLVAIGIATGQQVKGLANPTDTGTWAGQTVLGSDALVMYTYGGDANLDGKINVDDYGRIDSSAPLGISGWYNGDFNYDGKINVDDYGIIDSNTPIQGAPFFTAGGASAASAASLGGVSAVPEPATLSVLSLGAAALLGRRRRRSQQA